MRREPRPTSSTTSITPPDVGDDAGVGHAPGAGRDAVVEAVLLLRPRRVAPRAPRRTRCARRSGGAPATSRGSTWSTTTSSRCPTSGSTRGTRPGISPSTPSPLAMVDPDFAKSQLRPHALAASTCTRAGRSRPTSGTSATSTRPSTRSPTLFLHADRASDGARRRRPRLPQRVVHAPAAQLHMVGEPEGPGGAQPVRGRVPRPRQHRRVRPQRAAADRRPPRAGRRHGLDGDVQPEHARAGLRARRARPDLRGLRAQVRRALLLDRRGRRSDRRPPRRDVGRGGRASSTTCCGCPTARGQRLKVRSLVGLLPMCATTVIEPSVLDALPPAAGRDPPSTSSATSDLLATIADPHVPGVGGRPLLSLVERGQAAPRCSTRMLDEERFLGAARHPLALALAPRPPVRVRRRRRRVPGAVRAGGVDDGHVRRQLELARAGVVPDQHARSSARCCSTTATTATRSRSSARPAQACR